MQNYLDSLSDSQRQAVTYTDGPQLVIAGAGSGKTRVLTCKIAHLLSLGIKPWHILALTFTNKAAREMKDRVTSMVGDAVARSLVMGSFHSVFLRILRQDGEVIGLQRNFTIYDDADQRTLLTSIVKELNLNDKTYKTSTLQSRIGMAKNNLITPDAYLANPQMQERDARANMPDTGRVYKLYCQRCRTANAIDFDDMLLYTYMLFSNHPDVCARYADRHRYVLVDEYQDTNYAQQCILTLLTRQHGNICVVGDDAQSIYAFRGANIDNILHFQDIYPGARLFKLEQNYRSTQSIVEAANCLISHNTRQIHKHVFSANKTGDRVRLNMAHSDKEEAEDVCREIRSLHRRSLSPLSDMAILYRTNAQSRLFEEKLRSWGLPYRVYGGMSFYQRKEIKDIIAYLRLVSNVDDEEAFKRIVNYPKRGIGPTTIGRLTVAARAAGVSLWTVLADPSAYGVAMPAAAARRLADFRNAVQQFTVRRHDTDAYTLGREIVEWSGIDSDIDSDKSPEGRERKDNVDEFMSGLHDFVDTKRAQSRPDEVFLGHFLQEVSLMTDFDKDADTADSADSLASEPAVADKVSLMSIHSSKGLEFGTVFIVGVEENIFPVPRACDFADQLEEERRLFYVAITRARHRCIISCAKSRYQYGNLCFNRPSRFLYEIDRQWLDVNGRLVRDDGRTASAASPWAAPYGGERAFGGSTRPDDSYARPYGGGERPVGGNTRPVGGAVSHADSRPVAPSSRRPVAPPVGSALSSLRPLSSLRAVPSSRPSSAADSTPTLAVGTRIRHPRFGEGRVTEVTGRGENEKATVLFDNVGAKTLLLKFARFEVI